MGQLPRFGKRELICLLLFTCNYVVSVWKGFLFLWVLGMGYVILLWHSLSLPCNYIEIRLLGLWFVLLKAGGGPPKLYWLPWLHRRPCEVRVVGPLDHVQLQACLGCLLLVLLLSKFIVVVRKLVGGKK